MYIWVHGNVLVAVSRVDRNSLQIGKEAFEL